MSTKVLSTTETISPEACWELLERVAESSLFKPATRLRELLLYIGQRCIKDGCTQLREQEIGCAVFGRPEGYDTASDNIVRTSIGHLRRRIETYFSTEGASESLLIEIPRGSYVPIFSVQQSASAGEDREESSARSAKIFPLKWKYVLPLLSTLCLIILVLSFQCFHDQGLIQSLRKNASPWELQPNLNELWANFLGGDEQTDIVLSDTSFLLYQATTDRFYSLSSYMNRSFLKDQSAPEYSYDVQKILSTLALKNLGNSDEFWLAARLFSFDPASTHLHLYNAREYSAINLNQNNVVLIGGPVGNPWTELFNKQLTFTAETYEDNGMKPMVVNHALTTGENQIYKPVRYRGGDTEVGYCIIAFLPNPQHNRKVILIEGTTSEANQAAANLLFSETALANLKRRMHVTRFPYFEVLLKTSQVRSTPLTFTIEAYRTYSENQ